MYNSNDYRQALSTRKNEIETGMMLQRWADLCAKNAALYVQARAEKPGYPAVLFLMDSSCGAGINDTETVVGWIQPGKGAKFSVFDLEKMVKEEAKK